MTTRQDIMETARETLGTKWVHQGRLVHRGIDCVGVVLYVCRRRRLPGVESYEPPVYQAEAKWDDFVRYFQAKLQQVHPSEAKPGDVLCLRQNIYPCHCGVLTEKNGELYFVHSYRVVGRVVEERYTGRWRKLTRAAFILPGVE